MRKFQICIITILILLPNMVPAMNVDEARHLLTRTGFGASPSEINSLLPLTREQAVVRLVSRTKTYASTPAPHWLSDYDSFDRSSFRKMQKNKTEESQKMRQYFQRQQRIHGQELKAWWVNEMLTTESPLTEKMTLFWSNHFTSSIRKCKSPLMMYNQNKLLRKYSMGNFGKMLHAISKDPAMIIYLDNQSNNKKKPNENFARELLELFTLGEGHYSEQDIKQAARAFTGWKARREKGKFFFAKRQHDYGTKHFLGKTGAFNGNEIIDIVLQQQQVSIYIVEKLWREFISESPDQDTVQQLAEDFRRSGYEIKPLMRALLKSDHFWSIENRGVLVKSPIDLLVGTVRTFSINLDSPLLIVVHSKSLGQDLMNPPNVKGWPGGTLWIDSNTLLLRNEILENLTEESSHTGSDMRSSMMQKKQNQALVKLAAIKKDAHGMPMDIDAAMQAQRNVMRTHRQMNDNASVSIDGKGFFRKTGLKKPSQLAVYLLPISPIRSADTNSNLEIVLADMIMDPTYQLK